MRKSTFAILIVGLWAVAIAPAYSGQQKGPEGDPPPNRRHRPPLAAISACLGKQEGQKCEFKCPHGEAIAGACFSHKHLKACRPSQEAEQGKMQGSPPKPEFNGPPPMFPSKGGPGPEARSPDGQCPCPRQGPPPKPGFMAGRPFNCPGPEMAPPPPPEPGQFRKPGLPPEMIAACKDKHEGNACDFKTPWGEAMTGTCHAPDSKDALACLPKDHPLNHGPGHEKGGMCAHPGAESGPSEEAK